MNPTTTDAPTPTVFVLDTDSLVRDMIASLARAMRLGCESFFSGQEFLHAFDVSRPGCLVTEVRMPEIGGLEIQRRLASLDAPLPIVFLSAHATVPTIVRAMQLGAVNFLEKPAREHELWEAIQGAVQEDARRRRVAAEQAWIAEMASRLDPHELRILEMLGQGSAVRQVAGDLGVSVRTVEIRRNKLMQKLDLASQIDLLRFAFLLDTSRARNGGGTMGPETLPANLLAAPRGLVAN